MLNSLDDQMARSRRPFVLGSTNGDDFGIDKLALQIKIEQKFKNMKDAFLKFDQDRSGKVSKNEMKLLLDHFNLLDVSADRLLQKV